MQSDVTAANPAPLPAAKDSSKSCRVLLRTGWCPEQQAPADAVGCCWGHADGECKCGMPEAHRTVSMLQRAVTHADVLPLLLP